MQLASSHSETAKNVTTLTDQPLCPVCSGLLKAERDSYRCSRCYFTLCLGCEGVQASGPDSCDY